MKHLLCLGLGFTAATLARQLSRKEWRISGTSRRRAGVEAMANRGVEGLLFDEMAVIPSSVTHILSSVPPSDDGDPVVRKFNADLARGFDWIAYLSTTGVYGDHGGAEVDEATPLTPASTRGARRVSAEQAWQPYHPHLFRLPGIYGPGRNQLESLREGTAKRIIKPGQLFSRIHVDDIAGVLAASMRKPDPGRAYNVADDLACPPQDVVAYAAELLGIAPPPEIPFESANLSPMAQSFYGESKRVSNARMKRELNYRLRFPTYREGLRDIFKNSPHLHVPPGSALPRTSV